MYESISYVITAERIHDENGNFIPENQRHLEYAVNTFDRQDIPHFTPRSYCSATFKTIEDAENYWKINEDILLAELKKFFDIKSLTIRQRVVTTTEFVKEQIHIKEN